MSDIGWISTYNTRCGAATYSEHLIKFMKFKPTVLAAYSKTSGPADDENTIRCWNNGVDDFIDLGAPSSLNFSK